MKSTLLLACATAAFLSPVSVADHHKDGDHHEGHHHHHAKLTPPNDGRILHETTPHAELLVTKDRKLRFTFLDKHGKVVAPADQSISVICGKRSAPTRLTFAKDGDSLLSDKVLPDGKNIPTVIQFKANPEAKTTLIRLNLDLSDCPTCDHLEYACTCNHGHEGHDHE